jgi:hypothetical protein
MVLARHCAPVLLGKKPGALFPMPCGWNEALASASLPDHTRFLILRRRGRNALVFAYNRRLLARALEGAGMRETLGALGYPAPASGALGPRLAFLRERFRECPDFPHEVGFFLGYPPEDVLGFIRHQGRRCKLCGMWKVYGDAARAAALFAEYAECSERLLAYVQNGGAILRKREAQGLPACPVKSYETVQSRG